MHDNQLEDRIRAVLRAEGSQLPLTITPEELERRLSVRRRERIGRMFSLIAAGVGVIAIGSALALSNGWLRAPGVGSGPSPAPSASAAPSEAALPCETIDPTAMEQPPTVILGATPGDAMAYGGALGAFQMGDRQIGTPGGWLGTLIYDGVTWNPIPAGFPTERLQALAGNPDACLVGLTADAVPFDDGQGQLSPEISLAVVSGDPTRLLEFVKPPVGEWLIRVHAEFATGGRGVAWSETFFRVVVPDAIASPSVVPNVLPELPVPEATILSDEASAIDAPGEPTGVVEVIGFAPVPPRGIYQVDVVCLGFAPVRWSLGLEGESGFLAAGDQTCDGQPESQTLSLGVPPRDVPLFIQADAATAWHIVVSSTGTLPQLLPAALRAWPTVEPDGAAAAAEAFGHCVSSEFGADPCGQSWETAPDARRVRISSGDNVTFQLEDGWDIAQARVTAVAAGTFDPEYSVGFVDAAGSEVVIPIELDPGHWTVQMSLNARRGSESFGAWYNFPLEVTESHPAPPPSRHGPLRPAIFLRGLTSGDRRPYRASADRAHARDTLPRAPRGRRGRRYRPGRGRVKRGGNIDRLCREGPRGLPTSWRLQVGAVSSRAGRGSVEGHLTNERAVTSSSGPFQCRLRPLWLMRRPKARFPLQLRRMDHGRSNVAGRWPAGGMAEPVAT